jgi:ABC-type bacteriocin/lantibiotic exporter with double-glycine peptidase domain
MARFTRLFPLTVYPLLCACALSCASYQGTAQDADLHTVAKDGGWQRIEHVPPVHQRGERDCGAAVLSAVLSYYEPSLGRAADRETIDTALRTKPGEGLAASSLRDYAREHGFAAYVFKGKFDDLTHELAEERPVIVGLHKPLSSDKALAHYEVFLGYHPEKERVLTFDPAHGLRENTLAGFMTEWEGAGEVTLVVMPPASADAEKAARAE